MLKFTLKTAKFLPLLTKKQGDLSHKQKAFEAEKDKHKKTRLCVCIEAGKQCVNSEKVTEKLLKLIDSRIMKTITKKYKKSKKTKL